MLFYGIIGYVMLCYVIICYVTLTPDTLFDTSFDTRNDTTFDTRNHTTFDTTINYFGVINTQKRKNFYTCFILRLSYGLD